MNRTRVSINDWITPDKLTLVRGWAHDGVFMEDIAKNIGIAKSTLYDWIKQNKNFANAIKEGREVADYAVENALFKNALSGNVTAQIYWLNNRLPKKWKNRKRDDEDNALDDKLEIQFSIKDYRKK